MIIDLSDNIFRSFIDKDNKNICSLLKKLIHIYSRNIKRKKLYYFMKFYKICLILKYNNTKFKKYNRRSYSNLYNDYTFRNNKKDNIKIDQLYNESHLYPFSPLINHSGYMTFYPNTYRNSTPFTSRYRSYRSNNPLNQNFGNFENPYLTQRNIMTENDFYKKERFNQENGDDNYFYEDYINNFRLSNKNNNKNNNFRKNLNSTDYGFYNPLNKSKNRNKRVNNLYSNKEDDINSRIYEYLNDFDINKQRLNIYNPNNSNAYNKKEINPKRNKSNNNIMTGSKFDINERTPVKYNYNNINNTNNRRNSEIENYFNKKAKAKYNNNSNLKLNKNRLSFKKPNNKDKNSIKYNSSNKKNEEEDKNNKIIYNESKDYFYSFNNKNNNKNVDLSKKNSNASLNPSSLGLDQLKTFYTNKPKTTTTNNNAANSNINSASSRMLDTHYHFLNGLKMMSGEVNEYFYDFNPKRGGKDKREDQKNDESLQSLSDSKMMEIANHYLPEDDDSIENYQMNNIIYNRKKHNIK